MDLAAATSLLQMTMTDLTARIVVDPGSFPQGILTRFEIAALASGRLPIGGSEVLAAGTELSISPPSPPPPDDVVQAVRDELAAAWCGRRKRQGRTTTLAGHHLRRRQRCSWEIGRSSAARRSSP